MKLILIHGRAQQNRKPEEILHEWTDAFKAGLQQSNLQLPPDLKIELPYYGDQLIKLVDEAKSAQSVAATRGGGGTRSGDVAESEFAKAFLTEVALEMAATSSEQRNVRMMAENTRGITNWDSVQQILEYLDDKQFMGATILKLFTLDVFMYLTNRNIRGQINETVETAFDNEPCVVVAHSLGSVVAYDVLKNNPQYQIKQFITVGSPLGIKSVQKHIQPLTKPESLRGGWFNAYDERDVVALKPLRDGDFNFMPPIENKADVRNQTDNRHGISGYLNDKEVALAIYKGLMI